MKAGVIGIGAMGSGMAANLYEAGLLDCIWNRSPDKAMAFVHDYPVAIAADPAALAGRCDVIITCVSADADLHEVVAAMLPALREGQVIVDTSTVAAGTVRALAEQLAGQGVALLDAPVSGGVEGARRGELVMMVGGDRQALEKVTGVLETITRKIAWMGESGNGQATKAVNQVMAAGINQAVSEALAFAEALGLPLDEVIELLSEGAAGNWFLQNRGKTMVSGVFEPGFRVALHKKDLDLCREMAEAVSGHDMRMPIVEMTRLHYERLLEHGYGDEDISALFRVKRELFR